jgi:glycine/D-amino acid oxidase-like deaminating enzyme
VARENLASSLPNLRGDPFEITSPETPRYNCFAWAADDDQHWWEPPNPLYDLLDPVPTRYWPPGALPELSVDGLVSAFAKRGYARCDFADLEPEFEKIAIYVSTTTGLVTHAAKQLASGAWTSKIGDWEDIVHSTLQAVEGTAYGVAARFLRRPRRTP